MFTDGKNLPKFGIFHKYSDYGSQNSQPPWPTRKEGTEDNKARCTQVDRVEDSQFNEERIY